jgi:hypothetical protein
MPSTTPLQLDAAPLHVDVAPGAEIILRGSFHSSYDGSTIDAATTTWPKEAPGGFSVDPGGLVDLEAGGFHLTSRDAVTHEVHAISTGHGGEACAALHSAAPCLPLRLAQLGRERKLSGGITGDEMMRSLQGGITVEGLPPPVVLPATAPYVWGAVGLVAVGLAAVAFSRWQKHRAGSPAGQLIALARRVQEKLGRADAVLAAPLTPALESALRALKKRRIDAGSVEGKRVAAALAHVEARLDASVTQALAEKEQEAADELVREMATALEAADEVRLTAKS